MPELGKKLAYCRKPDLDSLATAFLLSVTPQTHELVLTRGLASLEALANPETICLECGGAGETRLLNFDHHDEAQDWPTAVEQAWDYLGRDDRFLELVNFVAWVDSGGSRGLAPPALEQNCQPLATLSTLISGLFLTYKDPRDQFWKGIEIISQVFDLKLRPWDVTPGISVFSEWEDYLRAKEKAKEELGRLKDQVLDLSGDGSLRILALSSEYYGVHGLLRDMGGEILIAHRPSDGKFTVSALEYHKEWLTRLSAYLNAQDPGWGGPADGLIIGSPFHGTRYNFVELCELLENFNKRR